MSSNGVSLTDIITLHRRAVGGSGRQAVLPILYNTFATLASLSRTKRMLRAQSPHRSDTHVIAVNRNIEIELLRYALHSRRQLDHPFNWKTNAIGMKTQRVEYADQVKCQPQVEIVPDGLAVSYSLDLGAVPNPHERKLRRRSTGLWAPVGCSG
ncbi:hypothetical protein Trco_006164 [Trichoderma cornu-damae]|uniref:Uncharacterized protein n=1 Tax=Trichoderma cornu-damae TaxID=654480 RepID=A0A9P8TT68_9HYPO|nr:hypothetical protein Trco_006164 [Trichoderma cornu-damae]